MHGYRDLTKALQGRASLVLFYSMAAVLALYLTGFVLRVPIAFVLIQVALLAIAAFVTAPNSALTVRLPVLWLVTALMIFGLQLAEPVLSAGLGSSMIALAVWILLAYWFISIVVSIADLAASAPDLRDVGAGIGGLGATLFAFSALMWICVTALRPELQATVAGERLLALSAGWTRMFPIRVALAGLIGIGLILEAADLFEHQPYRSPDPGELVPTTNSLADVVLLLVRWPYWLVVVISGFVITFVLHLGTAAKEAGERWIAQAYFGTISYIVGPLLIGVGHFAMWQALTVGLEHTARAQYSIIGATVQFLLCHFLIIIALTAYSLAPALIGLRWERGATIGRLWLQTIEGMQDRGRPAAVAVGKGFSLLGVFLIAAPLATLLPGGPRFGTFSALYVLTLAASAPYVRKLVAAARRSSSQTSPA